MYDPGFPEQNTDALWNWHEGFHVIGYAMTFPGTASVTGTNQNPGIIPPSFQIAGQRPTPMDPSQRVLVAGAVISLPGQDNAAQRETYQFKDIKGAWAGTHRSSYLDSSGSYPAGDNVGMLDGSARWRKFSDMLPRTDDRASPVFWW